MAKLTAKQEAFAQSIADGKSQADAYRASYASQNMSDKQIWEEASKLAKNPKVSQRVATLKQALADKLLWKREDSVLVLATIAREGDGEAAKIGAVKELNAMHGYNEPDKVNVNLTGITRLIVEGVDGSPG